EFVWKENVWLISGQKFQMYYQEEGNQVVRFRANPQTLEISKNSNYALSRQKVIEESFDQEVVVKKAKELEQKTEIEKDKAGDGLLTQDISDQGKIDTKLRGKKELELADAPKEAKKIKNEADVFEDYSGESSTDDLGRSHYDGDIDREKYNEEESKRHDGSADRFDNGNGDAGTDDVGPDKYKGKTEYSKNERKSQYGGESETDDLGKNHYSNQPGGNSAPEKKARKEYERDEIDEEIEEEVEKERKKRKESHGGSYDGESDTDDLGDGHYSSKTSGKAEEKIKKDRPKHQSNDVWEDEEEEEEENLRPEKKRKSLSREKGEYHEEEADSLSGKSHTDDLGEDVYSGKDSAQKKKIKAKKEGHSAFEEDEEEIEEEIEQKNKKVSPKEIKSGSKGGTDDLGSSHYSKKKIDKLDELEVEEEEEDELRPEKNKKIKKKALSAFDEDEEDEQEEYGGKSKTDNLGSGHYSGKVGKKKEKALAEDEEEEFEEEREVSTKKIKSIDARDKKSHMLEDILADGNAEDPEADLSPGEFDDPAAVKVPLQKMKPRLVPPPVEEEEDEEPTAVKIRDQKPSKEKTKAIKAEVLPEEPAVGDDGRPVVNDTATVKAVLKRKAQPNVEIIVQLDDFFDGAAFVKINGHKVSIGEDLELVMTFSYMKKSKRVAVNGKCIEVTDGDEGELFIMMEISSVDVPIFEQFMKLYQLRQQHVAHFLKTVQGR
ncbi:MAG: hypothetical protein K2P81_17430, partial [Bacteriovoracaceae bacterium]|nr:hypothetical protein [Bacteriovoracaceae bacterium]